ncbi:hypothetical protein ABZW18_21110 [Streptomyces sp. NPDC004647]|uniref:hypothetical protein n=1 Tax=Streptomyces sp. NPDC004647 TaxID=3154671 RepID=UPI0033BC65F4
MADGKVMKLRRTLHQSGVVEMIEAQFEGLPGPPGYPVRLVLLGLVCASYERTSSNLDDAFEIMTFGTSERLRAHLSFQPATSRTRMRSTRFTTASTAPGPA